MLSRYLSLFLFNSFIIKFCNISGINTDHMIMMLRIITTLMVFFCIFLANLETASGGLLST